MRILAPRSLGSLPVRPLSFGGQPPAPATDPARVPAVYSGLTQLLNWTMSPKGMTLDLHLREDDAFGMHPFREMSCGQQRGQRLRAVVSLPQTDETASQPPVYRGEAVLLKWSENNFNGSMIRLLLDDEANAFSGRHPFYGFRAGKKEGDEFILVAWAVADDETLLPPSKVRRRQPFNTLNPVKQSHILCSDIKFQRWLLENLESLVETEELRVEMRALQDQGKPFADAVVRHFLEVDSRAVMNQETARGEQARDRWREMLARYEDWTWGLPLKR